MRSGRFGPEQVALHVDGKHLIKRAPQRIGRASHEVCEVVENACVTDKDIQLAEGTYCYSHRPFIVGHRGHISDNADDRPAQPFHHRIDPLLGSIEDRHARSFIDKALHQRQAEP